MPRKGRGTELILKELESLTLNGQAKIKSPDYIMDIVTGKRREVDISIRHDFGTHKFLTIIECRDRKGNEDVTWIEQLVTKTKNLQANKIVAVSTNGFTDGAKKLGEHENVVLRTIRNFKTDEIKEWMELFNIGIVNRRFRLININIEAIDEKNKPPTLGKVKTSFNEKRIRNEFGEEYSFNEIIQMYCYQNPDIFNGLTKENPVKLEKFVMAPSNKILIERDNKIYRIIKMDVEFECWIETSDDLSRIKT